MKNLNTMMLTSVLLAFVAPLRGCMPNDSPQKPLDAEADVVDASQGLAYTDADKDGSKCAEACAKLKKLGCEEGNSVDVGRACFVDGGACSNGQACSDNGVCFETCEKYCNDSGSKTWLMPGCVVRIEKCEELVNCALAK